MVRIAHGTLYRIWAGPDARDRAGSPNRNVLVISVHQRFVVRVYRPWLTTAGLEAMQAAHHHLALGGVPDPLRIRTCDDASEI